MKRAEKRRADLYREYDAELAQYDTHEYPFQKGWATDFARYRKDCSDDPHMTWFDIRSCGRIVGFLITYRKKVPRHGCDDEILYILEAFVAPDYRRHGLMQKAVKRALKCRTEYVSMDVFVNNPAERAWEKIMQNAGYEKCTTYQNALTEAMIRYYYKLKE